MASTSKDGNGKAALLKEPPAKPRRVSRSRQPDHLSLEEWQVVLRRQYGEDQDYLLVNIGDGKVFSDFSVTNPDSEQTYLVAIRGEALGVNYCSCPDYSTNTLGTCKHIEFTLARLRDTGSSRRALAKGSTAAFSEVYLRYGLQRHVVFSPGSRAPARLRKLAADYFDDEGVLFPDAFGRFDAFLKAASQMRHELRCYDDALDFIAGVRDAEHRRSHLDAIYGSGAGDEKLDDLVKTDLYPYQREGVLFAARAGRSLIGDEMGLGKTVQAIAYAELMAREFAVEGVLVICPASLKYQWKHEIDRFSERSAVVIEGPARLRRELYETGSFFKIVNYDVIVRDLDPIAQWSPDIVVLDEAQRIKNWQTRTARTVKSIDSPYALVLTGTPLQNRLEELYSIVQFVDRHRLGPLFRFLAEHQVVDGENAKVVGYQNLSSIGDTLKPILLRRTKANVAIQLPERTDNNFFVPMTKEQWIPHDENREIVGRIVKKWQRYGFLSEVDQRRLMIALQYMRMACDSTFLLDQKTRFGPKIDELAILLGEALEEPDAKVVVFSQWHRMTSLVAEELERRGWEYVHFHGGVPSRKRKQLLTDFREDLDVRVFLSTDAGGVGLNLQAASVVVNMDLPWNPAVLEQRIGRVHRIGQQRGVRVVNYVSEGTIEHGMLTVLQFKQDLFSGVLDGGQDSVFMGGTRLSKFMESVESVSNAVPETAHDAPSPEDSPADPEEAAASPGSIADPSDSDSAPMPSRTHADAAALTPVLTAGVAFLKELGDFIQSNSDPDKPALSAFMETDEKTGRAYLKLPLPEPEAVEALATAVAPLLQMFQSKNRENE